MGSLLKFFSLTFAVTWICFTAAAAISQNAAAADPALARLRGLLFLLGTIAPSLVALALTARAEGRRGAQALLGRILHWQVGVRWYVFAVGYMAAVKLAVALVHRAATGAWPQFGQTPLYIMAAAIVVSTWVQAGEEIGWRGYALPRMVERLGLARASLLLPMILHAAVNNTKDIVPSAVPAAMSPFTLNSSLVAWLTAALLWIGAAYFLFRMRTAEPRQAWQAATV